LKYAILSAQIEPSRLEFLELRPHRGRVTDEVRLFAYGSLMRGEIHEHYLKDSFRIGSARTVAGYRLVELGQFPALIVGGDLQIEGELYGISRATLYKLDELKENGRLFFRRTIELDGAGSAEAYLMDEDKLRGRRRLKSTDWRRRFAVGSTPGRGR